MIYYGLTSLTSFGFPKNTQKSVPQILFQMNNSDRLQFRRVLEVDERHEELHIFKEPMRWIVFRWPCFYKGRDPSGVLLVLAFLTNTRPFVLREIPKQGFLNMNKAGVWRVDDGDTESLLDVLPRKTKISTWKLMLGRLYYTFPGEMVPFQGTFTFVFRWKNRWKNLQHHHLFFSRSSGTFPSSFFASSLSALSFSFGTSFKRAAFTFSFS